MQGRDAGLRDANDMHTPHIGNCLSLERLLNAKRTCEGVLGLLMWRGGRSGGGVINMLVLHININQLGGSMSWLSSSYYTLYTHAR